LREAKRTLDRVREAFADQLAELEHRMIDHLAAAANMLVTVAVAVEDPTSQRAAIIELDAQTLRERARRLDADLVVMTGRQAPAPSDLRLLIGLIEASHHAALIANQFELISQQLGVVNPTVIDGLAAREKLSHMCTLASEQLQRAAIAFHTRDLASAEQLERADNAVDKLNREIFEAAAHAELPAEQRELAFRHVLVARCLERVADNAVDIAEQAAFVVTAEVREFSDASQPRRRT
jgi:phosphate transport system protein